MSSFLHIWDLLEKTNMKLLFEFAQSRTNNRTFWQNGPEDIRNLDKLFSDAEYGIPMMIMKIENTAGLIDYKDFVDKKLNKNKRKILELISENTSKSESGPVEVVYFEILEHHIESMFHGKVYRLLRGLYNSSTGAAVETDTSPPGRRAGE